MCLPAKQYLNTTFLGPRLFIEAGPVNYTYFQFGPLNAAATGTPPQASFAVTERTSNSSVAPCQV